MMNLLQDTGVWVSLSFVIFMFILWKMGKDAFIGMLDKRIDAIKTELETAENLRIEAQELLAQYQRKHRDAVQEAEGIIKTAESQAAQMKKNAEKELDDLIVRREKQLTERISMMEQTAETEIRAYAADLAIKATREIIVDKLDKKAANTLIDQSIKSLADKVA